MSAVDLPAVKTHLNISSGTSEGELVGFISRAEAALAARIGPVSLQSKTERVRGCSTALYLSANINALTSVTSIEGTVIAVSQLTVTPGSRVEFKQGGYFSSRFYDVVYDAGWADVPEDLKLAVLEMVRHLWTTQRGGSQRPGSQASDQLSNSLPGSAYTLPFRVEQLIAPYASPGFA